MNLLRRPEPEAPEETLDEGILLKFLVREDGTPVIVTTLDDPSRIAYHLMWGAVDIASRSGLHFAPIYAQAVGTYIDARSAFPVPRREDNCD